MSTLITKLFLLFILAQLSRLARFLRFCLALLPLQTFWCSLMRRQTSLIGVKPYYDLGDHAKNISFVNSQALLSGSEHIFPLTSSTAQPMGHRFVCISRCEWSYLMQPLCCVLGRASHVVSCFILKSDIITPMKRDIFVPPTDRWSFMWHHASGCVVISAV